MTRYPWPRETAGLALTVSLSLAAAALAGAQQTDADRRSADDPKEALGKLVYVPHDYGAPVVSESGGARSAVQSGVELPQIHLLAPPKLARTLSGAPTLYWYLSGPSRAPVRVTVADFDESIAEPLLEVDLGAMPAGVHAISLAEHGVRLEPGRRYQWSVAIEVDPAAYSNEPVAKTILAVDESDPSLLAKLEDAPVVAKIETLGGNGYWYDVLDVISQQVANGDNSRRWRELRARLLEQEEVGLAEVAAFDRAAAGPQ